MSSKSARLIRRVEPKNGGCGRSLTTSTRLSAQGQVEDVLLYLFYIDCLFCEHIIANRAAQAGTKLKSIQKGYADVDFRQSRGGESKRYRHPSKSGALLMPI
jgi:hypothetical protein